MIVVGDVGLLRCKGADVLDGEVLVRWHVDSLDLVVFDVLLSASDDVLQIVDSNIVYRKMKMRLK